MVMQKLEVQVTQEDITRGRRCNAGDCPIARAIRRITLEQDVFVVAYAAYVGGERYSLPTEAIKFVWDFDMDHPVDPLKFKMETSYGC